MDLRVFTEPQQGASYDDLLRVARTAEDAGYDAFFRSDHYLVMGDGDGLPGPTDAWVTLAGLARETRRIRLGTLVTAGDVPAARRPRHQRGPGRRDERRPRRARPGHRLVRAGARGLRHRRSRRSASGSTASRSSCRSSPGLWDADGPFTFRRRALHAGRRAGAAQAGAATAPAGDRRRRRARGGHPASRRPTPTSSTCRSPRWPTPARSSAGSARRRRSTGRDLVLSVAQVLCCGRDDAEVARRAAAIGRSVDDLRANGVAGTPGRGGRPAGGVRRPRRDTGLPAGARPGRPRPRRAGRGRGAPAAGVKRTPGVGWVAPARRRRDVAFP